MKKSIALGLAVANALGMCISYADTVKIDDVEIELNATGDSIEKEEYQDGKAGQTTNVYAVIGSEFEVVIPKTIVLSGKDKKADYKVKVSGDIAGNEKVSVTPDETFKLSASNKTAVDASVTQADTEWDVDDVVASKEVEGLVSATDITAGSW